MHQDVLQTYFTFYFSVSPLLKILHVIDSGGLYGAEMMILSLMVEQKKLGHSPVLCSISSDKYLEKGIEKKARELNLNTEKFIMKPGLSCQGAARIVNFGKLVGADIFHSHGYKPNILLSLYPGIFRKIPLLSTIHGWTNTTKISKLAIYEWLDARLLKFKDAVVVVSRQLLQHPNIVTGNINPAKLYVVSNGISEQAVDDQNNDTNYKKIEKFSAGTFTIGAIGRLSDEKGYGHLIEAVNLLQIRKRNVKLIIIGEGPLRHTLNQSILKLKLENRVLFTGYLDNARKFMKLFDIYAISSLSEGLPITMLEAMQEKVPIISTGVGGIPEVIQHEKHGLLIPSADTSRLADAIERIIDDPDSARLYADNAFHLVQKRYSSSTMANAYDLIYKSVTKTRKQVTA